jgi:23S rRNA G2069 N7-methylase RlmK/C1962 C5-methylase RlmI
LLNKITEKNYEKLIKLALPLLDNNALLMINSCSYHLTQSDLINCVKNACFKNNKKSRLIRCSGAGFDHPVNPALKENEYLKCLTFFIE